PALETRLAGTYDVTNLASQPDATAYLKEHGAEFTALVTNAAVGVDNAVIDSLPNLKVISSFGVGLDRIDVAHANGRGVAVGYTPDVLNDCVADLAIALMLDAARGVSASDRFVRRGEWTKGPFPLMRKVSGAKLGVVGMGRIGRAIAQRAGGFSMDVRYHTRRVVADASWKHEPSLVELARWADYLIVITAGGAATRHLINDAVLDALGPEGFLVNVARGTVVDEQALLRALTEKRIAGAGLDVYQDEPNVPAGFMALDNVVLAPHIASGTRETRQAMADRVFDNLKTFFAEGKLVSAATAA
ncbi:MAG: 2-hydroxyacid dehydrogenase, partial [Ramlibacter sp.]